MPVRSSIARERRREVLHHETEPRHMRHTAADPVEVGLLAVPAIEDGIDGDEGDVPAEQRGPMERQLAQPEHGNRDGRPRLV